MHRRSNSRSVPTLGAALVAATLGMVLTTAEAGAASTTCITDDVSSQNGTHIKIVPFGCDVINSAPFTFTGVLDTKGKTHSVTIDTLEEFATLHGVGIAGGVLHGQQTGAFIAGTIGNTAFAGLGNITGVSPHGASIGLTLGVQADFAVTQDDISGGSLPAGFQMRIDPIKPSTGSALITDLQNGTFSVIDDFNLVFDLSLDGGASWVSIDPGFGLETFDPTTNPQLDSQLVPEPATLAIFGVALAGLGVIRRRRRCARYF